ncbi:rhomboid family GlyGly-CTERM serine protease [Natronospira proteinivora]|uniref:Rhomboid family GlyGly-CTERM serine protease n=1 Tax=Natronospira proteinivora TaxID=1807133 RepID=A0ABT1GBJ0_9GAMM|nr:rhombosortase [Natronospira proteinivora]MCP1728649.1 rhomboid family GlyGly-CTERM serine protease [Natronospira proteinivora]
MKWMPQRLPFSALPEGQGRRLIGVLLLLALPAALMAWLGETAQNLFAYQRDAIQDGQWWRWLSGHWVHFSLEHLMMNLLGLLLLGWLVTGWLGTTNLFFCALVGAVGISAGFWFFYPELQLYVGLSGVCAAVWAAGAVAGIRCRALLAAALFLLLVVRLILDFTSPLSEMSATAIQGQVVVEAHLYGAIVGACFALFLPRRWLGAAMPPEQ